MTTTHTRTLRPSYYLEINGKPCCVSDVHPRQSAPFCCGHGPDRASAEEHRRYVLRDHPDAVVVIRDGGCPASRGLAEAQDERRALDWQEQPDALDRAREWTAELAPGALARLSQEDGPVTVTFLGLLVEPNGNVCAIVQIPKRDLLEAVHFSRVRPTGLPDSKPIRSPR